MSTFRSKAEAQWVRRTSAIVSILFFALGALPMAGAREVTYYYTSPQGSVLVSTDAIGNIHSTSDYSPYGRQTLGAPIDGVGYSGHVQDGGTELIYMQARYYDPDTGRFIGVDPVPAVAGNIFSGNAFLYTNGNPVRYVDPDGRMIGVRSDFRGDYFQGPGGERVACQFCLSSESKAAFGSSEVAIGSGFVGRADQISGTDLYEVHVYEDSGSFRKALRSGSRELDAFEVGVMGPRAEWIAKHGHDVAPALPAEARNALRGYAAEMARGRGWLAAKGGANITGARLSYAIESGMQRTGSATFLRGLGRSLGPIAGQMGIVDMLISDKAACSSGAAQAGNIGEELNCGY